MKRALIGVVIVVVVGSVAFTLYNRMGAETPTSAVSVEAMKACPGTCGLSACSDGVCSAFKEAPASAATLAEGGTCKDHPDCTCQGECKGNPDCTCPAHCKEDCPGNCDKICKSKGTCPGAAAAQAKSTCPGTCSGKCEGGKAKAGAL